MKRVLLMLFALVMISLTGMSVPLSGTYYIPSGSPSYPSIAAAFTALNTNGVDVGGATFLVAPGYTETGLSLILSVPSANYGAQIIFKRDPSGTGANPVLYVSAGTSAKTDGGIIIAGTDYVTFDAIDVDASAQTTIEWGYALVKANSIAPFDGCQHVTITRCRIILNTGNANACAGIYSGNHTAAATTPALTITASSDACNSCSFDYNRISNVHTGVSLNGFNASANITLYDHNNEVGKYGKNVITNFLTPITGIEAYGVYCAYQDSITVMNDSIVSGSGSIRRTAGVTMTSGNNSNAEIANNIISVASSATGGNNLYGIWNNLGGGGTGPGSLNCIKIHDNTILNCSYTSATTGSMYGILNTANADTIRIYNNTIHDYTDGGTATFYVISSNTSANRQFIFNNEIYNITATSTAPIYLIYTGQSGITNIYSNNLHDASSNGGVVTGIGTISSNTASIYKNRIYSLTSGTTSGMVYGILNTSAVTVTIYNNFISDLKAPASLANPALEGMNLAGGTTSNIFYNTIYLNQPTASGASFGSCCIYASTTPTLTLKNNILVNVSIHGAAGYTVAYRRSGTTLATYSANSNYNDFYAGPTTDPNNLIFSDGTVTCSTLAAFQGIVSPRDAASFTENPPFMNVATTPYNLHIQQHVNTLCESGAGIVSTPVNIIDDFDGDARYPNPGYPNYSLHPATAPDVGADEFEGGAPLQKTLNLTVVLEGLYNSLGTMFKAQDENGDHFTGNTADQIIVELHNSSNYATIDYSAPAVNLSTAGSATITVPGDKGGSYYLTVKHRNGMETTSAATVSFAGSTITYAFDATTKAYGDNMAVTGDGYAVIYAGDENQDGIVDGTDLSDCGNQADLATPGYIPEDINGDGLVDGSDLSIAGNNAALAIVLAIP